jgi:hypothetical protein
MICRICESNTVEELINHLKIYPNFKKNDS